VLNSRSWTFTTSLIPRRTSAGPTKSPGIMSPSCTPPLKVRSSGASGNRIAGPCWSSPPPSVPPTAAGASADGALRLARLTQDLGYQGLASIDAVISPDGTVRFNEVNARLGGSTHLDAIATVLLGENRADGHVLLSRFSVPASPFTTLVGGLARHGPAWDRAAREGVVIASDDTEASGTVEYVVLAPTWSRCRALEAELDAYLAERVQSADH
jgi:PGM1 C-terminal domain